MAEIPVLTLDGIKTYVKDAAIKDVDTLENYRSQLSVRLTKELGHSPVRLAEITQTVARIDFELRARKIEDVVSEGVITPEELGRGIEKMIIDEMNVQSDTVALESVS